MFLWLDFILTFWSKERQFDMHIVNKNRRIIWKSLKPLKNNAIILFFKMWFLLDITNMYSQSILFLQNGVSFWERGLVWFSHKNKLTAWFKKKKKIWLQIQICCGVWMILSPTGRSNIEYFSFLPPKKSNVERRYSTTTRGSCATARRDSSNSICCTFALHLWPNRRRNEKRPHMRIALQNGLYLFIYLYVLFLFRCSIFQGRKGQWVGTTH